MKAEGAKADAVANKARTIVIIYCIVEGEQRLIVSVFVLIGWLAEKIGHRLKVE